MQRDSIKAFLCDIGGVLYVGDDVIDGAIQAIQRMKERYPVRFLTNTTQNTGAQVVEKLQNMGFELEKDEVITALDITKMFLQEKKSDAFYLLTDDARTFFEDLSIYPKNYVVVGDAQNNFTYQNLNAAFRLLLDKKELLAVAKNRYFMDADNQLSLDAGGFVQMLEFAADLSAQIIGKPSPSFYHLACASMKIAPQNTLMIGDDIQSDILGAKNAGLQTALVKTGKFCEKDLKIGVMPNMILDSIADIEKIFS